MVCRTTRPSLAYRSRDMRVPGPAEASSRLIDRFASQRARSQLRRRLHHVITEAVSPLLEPLRGELAQLRAEKQGLLERLDALQLLAAANLDDIPGLRAQLLAQRAKPAHDAIFEDHTPLISVRIATRNRSAVLVGSTIPSVLAQTYENLEIIVVGDGCTDDTEERLGELGDPRIRFFAMPHQGVYPTDPMKRWMVAGSPAMNAAAQLATGQWIAPLDDDDLFMPDHLQVLLDAALAGRYEMVYGRYRCRLPDGTTDIGVYPPQRGKFGFQAGMYMSRLSFFEWEPRSWLLDEPADWNVCRRMLEAGVRIGFVDTVVTELSPTGPRLPGL